MVLRGLSMVLGGVMRASGTVWVPTALGVLAIALGIAIYFAESGAPPPEAPAATTP